MLDEVPEEENNAQRGKAGVLASVRARERAINLKREPDVNARKRGSYGKIDSSLQRDGCR